MCTCASCEYTNGFAGKGFSEWPRGEPKGSRASAAEYASHVAHLWSGVTRNAIAFKPGQSAQYPAWMRGNGPVAPMPAWWYAWNNKASPARAEPARPAQACKPEQRFPAQDRQREAAVIYAMPKSKPEKRPVGRPPIGRRVVVNLEERHIKRAIELGGGGDRDMSAGIRKALERKSG